MSWLQNSPARSPVAPGFEDLDLDQGELGGTLEWFSPTGLPAHESRVQAYRVYLAEDNSGKNRLSEARITNSPGLNLAGPDQVEH